MKSENRLFVYKFVRSWPWRLAPTHSGQELEDALDEALDESFPASDPVAIKIERALNKNIHPTK